MERSLTDMSSQDIHGSALLRIHHKAISILLSTSLRAEQTASDNYIHDFECIVSLSEFLIDDPPAEKPPTGPLPVSRSKWALFRRYI